MSSNFDFLRNFDNDLHYLACIIEDEIFTSPSAVLTDATTFLEIIIYDIFKKNELEMGGLVYFKDKIMFLSQTGFLSSKLKKNMMKAYSIRNKMHSYNGDAKNHIHLNQLRAVQIHKLLFNVSWLYYDENSSDQFKVKKPNYIHPNRLKNGALISSEIGNGKCIICESKTKSEDEIFCRECKYKIEKSDNLKTLRKHFGFKEGFKRNELIEMGFEKGYIGPFLQEMKNDNLIDTVGKSNVIDKENAGRFIAEAESMMGVEKLLSDFKLKNIGLKDISNHEFYLNGKAGQYPYVGLYHLFSEIFHSNFISQISSSAKIEEVLNQSCLTSDELNEWYFNGDGVEHDIFNEKLIDEMFYYKKRDIDVDFKINEDILTAIKESEAYRRKEEEYLFSLFLSKTVNEKITKREALNSVGWDEKDLNEFLVRNPHFKEKFEKSYTLRKMEKFIKHFDYYNYDYSLKKNGLMQEEIENWLSNAKAGKEGYQSFLNQYNQLTLNKYVHYRKKGHTQNRSLKMVNCDIDTMHQLLKEFDNDLEFYFVNKSVELLKSGKTNDQIVKELDLTAEWFNESLDKGMNGEELYIELYIEYSQNAVPNRIKEFLEMINDKPLNNVLRELNIDEIELDKWYAQGKKSLPPYDSFYEEFLEYKKEIYVKTMLKTNSENKALKKSRLTKEELKEFEGEINRKLSDRSVEIVINELKKGNNTKKASKKASIKLTTIYGWLNRALNGDEYYAEFLEVYKEEYLIPIQKGYAEGIKQGASEKEIIRTLKRNNFLVNEDVKQLKQLNLFPKPEDKIIELKGDLEI